MSAPLVSVVVPAFNRADRLPRTLDSALAQDHPDVEVIVCDDGSTDETPALLRRYEERHGRERVRVIRQENAGAQAARNAAISASKGAYLQVLDSDDYLEPEKFSRQVAAMEAADADIAVCDYANIDESVDPPKREVVSNDVDVFRHVSRLYPVSTAAPLYRTRVLHAGLWFDPLIRRKQEMDFVFRFCLSARRWVHVPGALSNYVRHSGDRLINQRYEVTWYHDLFKVAFEYWSSHREHVPPENDWMMRRYGLVLAERLVNQGRPALGRDVLRSLRQVPGGGGDRFTRARLVLRSLVRGRRAAAESRSDRGYQAKA